MKIRGASFARVALAVGIAFSLAPLTTNTATAQATLNSTTQLKQACETSPNHRVIIHTSTEINQGVGLPNYEQVNSTCTIVLGNSASLEFDSVAMSFAGNLTIESATPNKLMIEKTNLHAATMSVALTGSGSEIMINEGRLRALNGDLTVTMANESKLDMKGSTISLFSRMLEASGAVRLNGGQKFSAGMSNGGIHAEGNVEVNLTGADTTLKADEWHFWSNRGQTRLNSTGSKTLIDMGRGLVQGWTAISFVMSGAESSLLIKDRNFNTFNNGPIDLTVGGNSPKGMVKFDQVRFGGDGSVTLRASKDSTDGVIELSKNSIGVASPNGLRNVEIETGANGQTIVKENTINAAVLARIATGSGGLCLSEVNTINAPTRQICQ